MDCPFNDSVTRPSDDVLYVPDWLSELVAPPRFWSVLQLVIAPLPLVVTSPAVAEGVISLLSDSISITLTPLSDASVNEPHCCSTCPVSSGFPALSSSITSSSEAPTT